MDSRSPITCHGTCTIHIPKRVTRKQPLPTAVLDSSIGKPASGIHVHVLVHSSPGPATALTEAEGGPGWIKIGSSVTNEQGRCSSFPAGGVPAELTLRPGAYQIVFETKEYFERTGGRKSFYPFVQVCSADAAPPLFWLNLILVQDHIHSRGSYRTLPRSPPH